MANKLAALVASFALVLTVGGQSAAVAAAPHSGVSAKHGALNHHITPAERNAAAARVKAAGIKLKNATPPPAPIVTPGKAGPRVAAPAAAAAAATMAAPNSMPDYFGTTPNYANSPLPPVTTLTGGGGIGATAVATVIGGLVAAVTVTTPGTGYTTPPSVNFASFDGSGAAATATVAAGVVSAISVTNPGTGYGGIRKFVDSLPGLDTTGTGTTGQNDLGQAIPVAVPDTTTYPGSPGTPAADYYVIELGQYSEKLHKDLPLTTLRGYRQVNFPASMPNLGRFSYLGPLIVAQKDKPVRVKFINSLPTGAGGNLFLPVDTTVPGSGMGPTGDNYAQNRATIHLHGGNTPWISDGTEHQWVTPAGEATAYPKGVSAQNVPDMPDPGPGAMTFYYTNQQSARLMFYHDHSLGTTRLNVYAGSAAGYLLRDTTEQGLTANGTLPAAELPLIIQDKTFVPGPKQLAAEDPTWAYGAKGGLWLPHTYMTNQDPADLSGANPMGRWDYGPWFWPPFTAIDNNVVANPLSGTTPFEGPVNPGTPNPSIVPESFMDTPLVNGTAYPTLAVTHQAYRLRILNASDDRTLNLQLYYAKSNAPMWRTDASGNQILNDGNAGEVPMVVAAPNPLFPTWPSDGRDGGVPDPTKAGPPLLQIGTEGGFLPAVATLQQQPIDYIYNRRDITVLNVSSKTLFLGPAERADVIVDFSAVPAGSQLILYNDAPAPVPAFDPRYDYYTGSPDNTPTGGAPSTLLGYGPNTRTIMQFQVTGTPTTPFDVAKLTAALPKAYGATQDAPIVPETAYNAAYPFTSDATAKPAVVDTYSRIQQHSLNFFNGGPVSGLNVVVGGTGYTTAPTVTITPAVGGAGSGATGTATVNALGVVTALTLLTPGSGYTGPPIVTLTGGGGTGALASANGVDIAYQPKSIVEDFDTQYGRMNAMLGMEIPRTTAITNTAIPFYQADPPTEIVGATANPATPLGTLGDGTQIWKITHNGVDTHAIHWHLFNVQIINRVGWDGAIRPTDANELGWKETVRMSPLEDIIVALRPIVPIVPFDLPNSIRPLDPTQPVGSQVPNTFHNIDPTNEPATVTNELINFGFEYVWHCHLLGHEENDMMRPIIIGVAPKPATGLTATPGLATTTVLTWNDNSLNETAFIVQRATAAGGPWTDIATVPGSADPSGKGPVSYTSTGTTGTTYFYQVVASNLVGYTQTYAAPVVGYPHPSFNSAPSATATAIAP